MYLPLLCLTGTHSVCLTFYGVLCPHPQPHLTRGHWGRQSFGEQHTSSGEGSKDFGLFEEFQGVSLAMRVLTDSSNCLLYSFQSVSRIHSQGWSSHPGIVGKPEESHFVLVAFCILPTAYALKQHWLFWIPLKEQGQAATPHLPLTFISVLPLTKGYLRKLLESVWPQFISCYRCPLTDSLDKCTNWNTVEFIFFIQLYSKLMNSQRNSTASHW